VTKTHKPKWNWSSPGRGGAHRPIRKRDDPRFIEIAHFLAVPSQRHQDFAGDLFSVLNHYDHDLSREAAEPPSPSEVSKELKEVADSIEKAKHIIQSMSEVAKRHFIHAGQGYSVLGVDEEGNPALPSPLEKFRVLTAAISDVQNILSIAIQDAQRAVRPGQPGNEAQDFLVGALIDVYLRYGGSYPSSADTFVSDETEEYGPCHRFIEEVSLAFDFGLTNNMISYRITHWRDRQRELGSPTG